MDHPPIFCQLQHKARSLEGGGGEIAGTRGACCIDRRRGADRQRPGIQPIKFHDG